MPAFPSEFGVELGNEIELNSLWPVEATARMNRMYRRQRYVYDFTRRYYLLGRDQLIENLQIEAGSSVLEIGCGTGRNLVQAAKRFPGARFFGIDVSTEMLTSAIASIARRGFGSRIRVAHGDATAFDPQRLFGMPAFDHVMISYSLSMIPAWNQVISSALWHLKPGGRLHIVDFGGQEQLPGMARALLLRWLDLFDVTPRDDLERVLSDVAKARGAELKFERPFRGYAQYAVLTLPSGPARP
jgi:S-adenosylmethionine-diacylgycerolhomoserine-N-methlytransferase